MNQRKNDFRVFIKNLIYQKCYSIFITIYTLVFVTILTLNFFYFTICEGMIYFLITKISLQIYSLFIDFL